MTVFSMTGFARHEGIDGDRSWIWEVKSVNGRGLEIRSRLPNGLDRLEGAVRAAVTARLKRGSVSINLALAKSEAQAQAQFRINEGLLGQLLEAVRRSGQLDFLAPSSLDGLLAVPGVVTHVGEEEEDEDTRARRDAAMLKGFDATLTALETMRAGEGARLADILLAQLAQIKTLCDQAEASAALQPAALKAKLALQVQALLDTVPSVPEERLAQEAALLAAKADVREELDRLRAHLAAAAEMLQTGGPIGRRLDFLCQEFNREANTVCSKAADVELTRIGLALKVIIEQFREQVQNIE